MAGIRANVTSPELLNSPDVALMHGSPKAGAPKRPTSRWLLAGLASLVMIVSTLGAGEVLAQLFTYVVLKRSFAAITADPRHYYRKSENEMLGYELHPDFELHEQGRALHINSRGLRGPEAAPVKSGLRLAILGDSVTFSTGLSDEQTVPHLVQEELARRCGQSVEVINLGVPGYGTQELAEQLRVKSAGLELDGVVYLLNLNDFARRNTLREGADNGLYRDYVLPTLKLPWLIGKAVYRWHKSEPAYAP